MQQLYPQNRNRHREAAKMRQQRNTFQIKEKNKTTQRQLNKMDTSNLIDTEFKTLVIRMLNELREEQMNSEL